MISIRLSSLYDIRQVLSSGSDSGPRGVSVSITYPGQSVCVRITEWKGHTCIIYVTEDVALETETGDQGRYVYTIITCKYGVHILIVCTTAIISTSLHHDSLHVCVACRGCMWLIQIHPMTCNVFASSII